MNKKTISKNHVICIFNGCFNFFTCTYESDRSENTKLFIKKSMKNISRLCKDDAMYILISIETQFISDKKIRIIEKWANEKEYLECINLKYKPITEWNAHNSD